MIQTIIRALIRESLLREDRIQDLIDTDPSGALLTAKDMGVTNIGGLMWLKSMINKRIVGDAGEPIADVAPVIVSFFGQGMSDRLGRAGLPTDIMRYKNPGELRQAIETLGTSKGAQKKAVKQGETDIVYESDKFLVVMPRSTASACYYGKGTTWCTAATESNLFLTYVGSNRGIIFYHILKKGSDSRTDAGSKINVATVKGKPYFSTEYGGLSVDAVNAGLSEEKYRRIVGDEAQPVLDAITKYSEKLGNKHPAAREVDAVVANLPSWKAKTDSFNAEVYNDFVSFAFKERIVNRDILEAALNDPRLKDTSKYYIYENSNFDIDSLIDSMQNANDATVNTAVTCLASRKDVTYEQLQRAIQILEPIKHGQYYIARLHKNPAIPTDVLISLYNEKNNDYLGYIAANPNLPDDFIQEKIQEAVGPYTPSQPKSQNFIIKIALSRKEYARQIWDTVKNSQVTTSGSVQLRLKVAETIAATSEDPQLLSEIAQAVRSGGLLSKFGYDETRKTALRSIITNSATPDDVIRSLAKNANSTLIEMLAQARLDDPNFNEEDVVERHKEEYPEEYEDDEDDYGYSDNPYDY